jgi:hypothetical protein
VLFSLLAVGCSSTYQQADVQTMTNKLDASQGVLISQPQDGSYETTQYQNSGQMTAQAIYAAFFYLTETDPTVIAARKEAELIGREKLPDPKTLINNGDYKEATKELIIQTGLDSIFDVKSKNFDSLLNSFYSKV